MRQHYAVHPVPARLIASPMPTNDEGSDLAVLLAELAGRAVPLFEPRSLLHKAWSDMAIQNAKLAVIARNQASAQQEQRLHALQDALGLNEQLQRIECFDISHTQGEATVASCVVYDGNGMKKADYRRYNIRDIQPGDDYAAMRQVITRRYEKVAAGEGVAPDLILIDGGKGQISSAKAALADLGLAELAMIGVAKGEDRKPGLETLIFPDDRLPLQLSSQHPALHLIQEIRDEAHRFAITGHRAKRSKARKTSTLESLPGIGPARRKALVSQFGGLAGVLEATIEQLVEVPGISREQAEKIYAALH
jgi:excinuclease ABC subunit C